MWHVSAGCLAEAQIPRIGLNSISPITYQESVFTLTALADEYCTRNFGAVDVAPFDAIVTP
jgi:hypothetical protein